MYVDKSQTKLVFNFQADEWFLVKLNEVEEQQFGFPYSLNHRIDRSEKGKDDDIGIAKIYLDEEEAECAKQNGFTFIE